MKIKKKTIEDILHIYNGGTEILLLKVRGRGWFMSTGGNTNPKLTLRRLNRWITEENESGGWKKLSVNHFHMEAK